MLTTDLAREVNERLGTTLSPNHFIQMIRGGRLAPPPKDSSGRFVWGERDIQALYRALKHYRPRNRRPRAAAPA